MVLCSVLAFVGCSFRPLTPEEAVKKSFQDKTITPVVKLYDNTSDADKLKVGYQITENYLNIANDIVKSGKKEEIFKLKEALSKLDVDNGKREYLGVLFNIKASCYDYAQYIEEKEKFEKDFEKKFKKPVSEFGDLSMQSIAKRSVYIYTQTHGKYIAYGYKYISFFDDGTYFPDFDNCIGVIEPLEGAEVSQAGVYTMNLINTNRVETLVNDAGFQRKVPVYLAVSDAFCKTVQLYDNTKYTVNFINKDVEHQKSVLATLKEAYINNPVHSMKLDDFDLTTTKDVFDKKYKIETSTEEGIGLLECRYTNGVRVRYSKSKVGKVHIFYYPFKSLLGEKALATDNGITIGMSKEQVKSIMGKNKYAKVEEENFRSVYLMPNAQFVSFYFSGKGLLGEVVFSQQKP